VIGKRGLCTETNGAMEINWDSASRLALIRFPANTTLTGRDAEFLIEALRSWIGVEHKPFAILADATGVRGADAEYRANTTKFYRQYRNELFIALVNVGPFVRVLAEMFRVGSGLQVKAFAGKAEARAWLLEKGIAA
jgi:hypothetical protein